MLIFWIPFQVSYREYCKSRFSKLIGKAAIFDEENEEYALNRCKEIWEYRYPSEPFESEFELNLEKPCVINEDLLDQVSKQRYLYTIFNEPYRSEVVYLIAARQSYKGFLYSLNRISERCSLLVPPSDVLLMWLTHQVGDHIYFSFFVFPAFWCTYIYMVCLANGNGAILKFMVVFWF